MSRRRCALALTALTAAGWLIASATSIVLPVALARADEVGPGREPVPGGFAPTVRVPGDAPTIQAGVDLVQPGGMVLIAPGRYEESVIVATPFITIRGTDRNRVILDGGLSQENGIQVIDADGVTVQNMTARNYLFDGFLWSGVHGFLGQYLTAYDNGERGIVASGSDWGRFDHVYASGSSDAGLSISSCSPCHAVITEALAEHNALGFSGTNAGGDLAIVNSEWRSNMAGIVPNTLDSEALAPQRDITIAGNYVHDNNATSTVGEGLGSPAFGNGILVAGGSDNLITENLIERQASYGIAVMPNLDGTLWVTSGNRVLDNVVRDSGLGDLALGAPSAGGDCFSGNTADRSLPPAIEWLRGCGSWGAEVGGGDPAPTLTMGIRFLDARDRVDPPGDWTRSQAPAAQPGMVGPQDAPAQPAIPEQAVPQRFRIRAESAITPVTGPTIRKDVMVYGVPLLASSWWSLLIGLYGYVLPGFVYGAWLTIALWDLIRQESVAIAFRARWMLAVILIPFVGPIVYFAFGRSPIPRQLRLMLVVGGAGACLAIALLAALLGG